jgi:N-carbamoyl-L-amino-acid hydrolase
MEILVKSISSHVQALSKIGNLGPKLEDGFTRPSWSDEETAAMDYIKDVAIQNGFKASTDAIGNLFLSFGCDENKEVVQIGSHLDTVVKGGLFDGGAGIIAGMEALIAVSKTVTNPKKGLELVIWRGEESGTFGVVFKGSKAAFGLLPASALESKFGDLTLREAIKSQGFDPSPIEKGERTISQDKLNKVAAHFELHIEQATKLEIDGDDIGVVTSIRGPNNYRISVRGEASHAGATPMGIEYRKDANLAMAYMHVELDKMSKEAISKGADLVQTVGVINSDKTYNQSHLDIYNTGLTTICAYSYFYLNVRSNDKEFLASYSEKALELINKIAEDFRVKVEIEKVSSSDPLKEMDPHLQNITEKAAKDLGYKVQRLPSGAGHDVQIVAQQKKSDGTSIPSLLVFIPCKDGLSHNPKEFTTNESITKCANVLMKAVMELV